MARTFFKMRLLFLTAGNSRNKMGSSWSNVPVRIVPNVFLCPLSFARRMTIGKIGSWNQRTVISHVWRCRVLRISTLQFLCVQENATKGYNQEVTALFRCRYKNASLHQQSTNSFIHSLIELLIHLMYTAIIYTDPPAKHQCRVAKADLMMTGPVSNLSIPGSKMFKSLAIWTTEVQIAVGPI